LSQLNAPPGLPYDVVIPTLGRASLCALLRSLADAEGPLPEQVYVVDDRPAPSPALFFEGLGDFGARVCVLRGAAAGPAAARNRGWSRARSAWIAFLDDDVVVEPFWRRDLVADLAACDERYAGSQGRVSVPLPSHRPPTDWERNVGGLERSRWITADCAYRRAALRGAGGFDERFPRAYREDAELALRLVNAGLAIAQGRRRVVHPVRAADRWISLQLQAGNADEALMRALHGADWYERAGAPRGRIRRHLSTVVCALAAAGFGLVWSAMTARFAWERIAPGPRDAREITTMLVTSALIPFAAVFHRARAMLRLRDLLDRPRRLPAAVLFDRDGTLVIDDAQLSDPARIRLVPGARKALARLRTAGIEVGVVTNQARVGDGSLPAEVLAAIHARLEELAGPFATIRACVHRADAACLCRKPQPGLVNAAADAIGVDAADCVVVGDIGSDVEAARAAGARAILVPTKVTLKGEIEAAPLLARDLAQAVDFILSGAA